MHRFRPLYLLAALSLGCFDSTGSNSITLNFDFTNPALPVGEGWMSGIADVSAAQVGEVELAAAFGSLPSPWDAYTGIRQGGNSVDGKVFLFHKKWISSPWTPGSTFSVRIDGTVMSYYATGCTTGPGRVVLLKAGASGPEPAAAADGQGILRFSLDKGTGTSGGGFALLGNVTNGVQGCPPESPLAFRRVSTVSQSEPLVIDANGGFWIFIGTESTYTGRHDVYLLGIRLTLTPTS